MISMVSTAGDSGHIEHYRAGRRREMDLGRTIESSARSRGHTRYLPRAGTHCGGSSRRVWRGHIGSHPVAGCWPQDHACGRRVWHSAADRRNDETSSITEEACEPCVTFRLLRKSQPPSARCYSSFGKSLDREWPDRRCLQKPDRSPPETNGSPMESPPCQPNGGALLQHVQRSLENLLECRLSHSTEIHDCTLKHLRIVTYFTRLEEFGILLELGCGDSYVVNSLYVCR